MAKTTDFNDFATEHPNYFPGQYLLEDDFKLQHKYLSDRQKYYKQSLHVSGIIEGLEVEVTEDKKVKIKPGSAIDSMGNLIVLKEEKIEDIPDIGGELYIEFSHKYNEDTEQQENIQESFTRWQEKPILIFKDTTPENAVKLAKLTISGEKITLDVEERQYSGISLPNSNGKALILRSGGNANSNLAVLTGSLKIDGDLTVVGAITPSFGESENDGIMFAKPPGDNSGDAAWIRYYQRRGRATTLEIGSGNDAKDHIVLMPSKGNVGIGTKDPGDYKLNVKGNQYISGDLTIQGNFTVQGNMIAKDTEHQPGNVLLGDEDEDTITIQGTLTSAHSSGFLKVADALHVTESLKLQEGLEIKGFSSEPLGDSDEFVPTERAVKNYINTQTQTLEDKIENTSIPEVTTDSNFQANNDAVPTVGAVYDYIQSILKFLDFKQEIKFDLGNDVFLEMVYIPGGTFLMGALAGAENDEYPQHKVTVSSFYMGKYPITQAQWKAVMGNNPSDFQGTQYPEHLNQPVETVSWEDCYYEDKKSFCQELTQKLTQKLILLGIGEFRLPSEAEWEYACRAGTSTKYFFGTNEAHLSEYAWYEGNSQNKIHPVGQLEPNNFGLYDMSGNVWEWCQDSYHFDYKEAPTDGSAWIDEESYTAIIRGGSWRESPFECRSSNRGYENLDTRSKEVGLRVVFALSRT